MTTEQTMDQTGVIVIRRLFDTDPKTLFKALTDPAVMSQWFFVEEGWTCNASNTLQVGGRYQVLMTDLEGNQVEHSGVYQQIDPPNRLVFSWELSEYGDTVVSLDLHAKGAQTELILSHDFRDLMPNHELAAIKRLQEMHHFGWDGCLGSLQRYLQSSSL